ncbi:MAG: aromatic ring-hydroxylating dioxygenase subunit alpha [Gemmatimonadota bacterium]|nr:aromatic ring-hydroxylating dioxygenase subunit alpha [Gemmatimonadota bacterium]
MTTIRWRPRELPTHGQMTLPRKYFISPEILQEEFQRLFTRQWLCVDREERIAGRGDFFLHEFAGESIIILRDQGGTVRAFYNVCRHRGSKLCEEHQGQFSETIQCPYHAWTYGLDGRLIGAPATHDLEGFRKQDWPLHAVPVATWEGFIFINLSPDPVPFEESHAPLLDRFRRFNIASLKVGKTIEYDVKANWKLVVQNYSECYHCPLVHPTLTKRTPPTLGENDLVDGPFLGGYMILAEDAKSMTMSGRVCGLPVDPALPAEDHDRVYYYSIMPNMLLSLHPDYVMYHVLWPVAPDRTQIFCHWLFNPKSLEPGAFDIEDGVKFWDMTNREDWHVCELSQAGITSRAYTSGPYSRRETVSAAFDRDYIRAMEHPLSTIFPNQGG